MMRHLVQITFVFLWLAGIVLAKGFWLTALAYIFPLYGLYLLTELLMRIFGII